MSCSSAPLHICGTTVAVSGIGRCEGRYRAAPAQRGRKDLPMFGILGWIVFGIVVGAVAKLLMPGKDPGGILITMLLGIVGAVLGGWLGRSMGMYGANDPAGFLMSLVGAVVLLFVYRMATGRRGAV
jgi:uncharacterized membrane protein YeaQ/YmgE (transglycosylase-associated protein family)